MDATIVDSTWRRVPGDAFDSAPSPSSDSEYEWEHEDSSVLVTLDLGLGPSRRLLATDSSSSETPVSLSGLETTAPLLKVGHTLLRGRLTHSLGTDIILPAPGQPHLPAVLGTSEARVAFHPIYNPESQPHLQPPPQERAEKPKQNTPKKRGRPQLSQQEVLMRKAERSVRKAAREMHMASTHSQPESQPMDQDQDQDQDQGQDQT